MLTVTGWAPKAVNRSRNIWPSGTRIRTPARSSGRPIGRSTMTICLKPFSSVPWRNRWMPLAAHSRPIKSPRGPLLARSIWS